MGNGANHGPLEETMEGLWRDGQCRFAGLDAAMWRTILGPYLFGFTFPRRPHRRTVVDLTQLVVKEGTRFQMTGQTNIILRYPNQTYELVDSQTGQRQTCSHFLVTENLALVGLTNYWLMDWAHPPSRPLVIPSTYFYLNERFISPDLDRILDDRGQVVREGSRMTLTDFPAGLAFLMMPELPKAVYRWIKDLIHQYYKPKLADCFVSLFLTVEGNILISSSHLVSNQTTARLFSPAGQWLAQRQYPHMIIHVGRKDQIYFVDPHVSLYVLE